MFSNPNYKKAKADLREADQEFMEWLRTSVSTWTENELDEGREPTVERFVADRKEYDHDDLIEFIHREIKRISILCRKEVRV